MTFPASPTSGQQATEGGRLYQYNGSNAWELLANVAGHAAQHATGGSDVITPASIGAVATSGLASFFNSSESVIDTIQRNVQNGAPTLTSGSMQLTFFTPLVTRTITQITVSTGGTAAAGLTLARCGLYTFDESTATLVAAIASDTTLFTAANTVYTRSLSTGGGLPSSYTLTAGSRYGLAVLVTGTTMPNIIGFSSTGFNLATLSPRTNGQRPSLTDLSTSFGVGNISVTTISLYARLS